MNCPRCQTAVLAERDRDGITVDACATCRGLWLDRGELEKLIARAYREFDEASTSHDSTRNRIRYDDDDDDRHPNGFRRKRRWFDSLGDIFD